MNLPNAAGPISRTDPIPYSVIRRVNRVRQRIDTKDEEVEEVLDDIFVLWRAFEATWGVGTSEIQRAEEAVTETISRLGIGTFEAIPELVTAMRAFLAASQDDCAEWFPSAHASPKEITDRVRRGVRRLQSALAPAERWNPGDSRRLAYLMYKMRCAVVHASLDTTNHLAKPILPAVREALIELTIARTAASYGLSLSQAKYRFDSLLQ
jgi:hypothetical protein